MDPAGSKNCFWMGVAYFGWSQRKRSTHWSESRILTRKTRPVCIGRWPIFVQYISVYFFFLFEPWGPIDKIVRNFPLFSFPLYESQILFNFFFIEKGNLFNKRKGIGCAFLRHLRRFIYIHIQGTPSSLAKHVSLFKRGQDLLANLPFSSDPSGYWASTKMNQKKFTFGFDRQNKSHSEILPPPPSFVCVFIYMLHILREIRSI